MSAEVHFCQVRLIGVPVSAWDRARRWFEGMIREFDIVAADCHDDTPRELVQFDAQTREKFSRFSAGSNAILEAALERGETNVDVEVQLPPDAAVAARELWLKIVAADDFCRRGDFLTLALPDDLRGFIRWYLDEVANQIEGDHPRPWKAEADPAVGST